MFQHFCGSLLRGESPLKLRRSSLTSSSEQDEGDDGFLELLEGEEHSPAPADSSSSVPSGLDRLLSAPMMDSPSDDILHGMAKAKRPLFSRRLSAVQDQENSPLVSPAKLWDFEHSWQAEHRIATQYSAFL